MNRFRRWRPERWRTPFSRYREMDVSSLSYASRTLSLVVCVRAPDRDPIGSWGVHVRDALAVEVIPEVALSDLWSHVWENLGRDWFDLGSCWRVPESPWLDAMPWRNGLALASVIEKEPGPLPPLQHLMLNGETTSVWVATAREPTIRQLTRGRYPTEEETVPLLLGASPEPAASTDASRASETGTVA
jgi:hypothetical protein